MKENPKWEFCADLKTALDFWDSTISVWFVNWNNLFLTQLQFLFCFCKCNKPFFLKKRLNLKKRTLWLCVTGEINFALCGNGFIPPPNLWISIFSRWKVAWYLFSLPSSLLLGLCVCVHMTKQMYTACGKDTDWGSPLFPSYMKWGFADFCYCRIWENSWWDSDFKGLGHRNSI